MKRNNKISLLSVPFGLGAGRSGSEAGPDQLRSLGLTRQLELLGYDLIKKTIVESIVAKRAISVQSGNMKHVVEVCKVGVALAEAVHTAITEDNFPLIIGGDHSIAIGSIAGLTTYYRNMGIIWFDAHADLNTEDTSPSGNMHGLSLAFGLGRTRLALTKIIPDAMPVSLSRTVIIGARQLDPAEREFIDAEGIRCFGMDDIERMGIEAVVEEAVAIAGAGADGIHLSFDIDSIDPNEAPGTGTLVEGGISAREARLAFRVFNRSGKITSAEFVELNPFLDRDNQTSKLMAELIVELLIMKVD